MGFENLPTIADALVGVERGARRAAAAIREYQSTPIGTFTASETGGRLPGLPTGGGFSQVPTTALPGRPGIYIPEDFSAEAVRRRQERTEHSQEEQEAMIARLQALVEEMNRIFGPENFFASIITQQIENLQGNVVAPQEALAAIRGLLGGFFEGIQNEMATATAEQRRFMTQFLQFLQGGALPTPRLPGTPPTPGPAPAPGGETGPPRTVTAGIR